MDCQFSYSVWVKFGLEKSLSGGMNGKNGMVKKTYLGMRLALMMKA